MRVAIEGFTDDPFTLEQVCGGFNAQFVVHSIVSSKDPLDMVLFLGMDLTARIACIHNPLLVPDSTRRFLAKDPTHPVIAFYNNHNRLRVFEQILSYMAHALVKKRVHAMPLPESLVDRFCGKNMCSFMALTFVRDFNLEADGAFLIFAYMCRRKMQQHSVLSGVSVMTPAMLKHRWTNDQWPAHTYYKTLYAHIRAYIFKISREYWIFARSSGKMKATNNRLMWQRNSDYFVDWLHDEHDWSLDETLSPKKLVNTTIMIWLQHRHGGGIGFNSMARTLECMVNEQPQTGRLVE